jgi:ABC-type transport system involved in multi-copper enzyme maturation permease subunit
MNAAFLLPPSVSKEVRALALPWLACAACMLGITATNSPRIFGPLAVISYLVGTVALGGLSMGHEYTGRTLGLLLTLPARRERLLATKLGVLTIMLLALWLVAEIFLFSGMPAPDDEKQLVTLIPLLCALFLAPWLTMLCRSSIAATVFALSIPGVLMVVGELLGWAMYGNGPVMEAFRMTFVWFGTLGLCAVGAVMSWRMFMRLEAIDGPRQDVRLPQWLKGASAAGATASHLSRRNPVWLLARKEVRLQHLPLALTALYVLEWITVTSLDRISDVNYGYLFASLTMLHGGLLPLLIGSFASAGERQIDTLESQLLLPTATSKQWTIKLGVVFALTIALAIALPALLSVTWSAGLKGTPLTNWEFAITAVMLLASGSLYISSLCRSGLWALVLSMPAVVGSALFLQLSFDWLANPSYAAARSLTGKPLPRFPPFYYIPSRAWSYVLIAGVILLALRFAFINHRFADRPAKRVWVQVIVMATFVAVGIAAGAAWQAFRS